MGKTVIIAEAGVNHNGDINLAKKMIRIAAEAGADYVKFQTFKSSKLASSIAPKADYQNENLNNAGESQLEMLKRLELSEENHFELMAFCAENGIKFLSTAFDLESLDFLQKIGQTLYKIPSGEITNLLYLEKVGEIANRIILSTGMSTMDEIQETISVLRKKTKAEIIILHCNTEYPTPFQDVNLLAMNTIKNKFGVEIGYSDHTLGIEVPIAAVALGAVVVEKHFTMDRKLPGPDHSASLEPDELKAMVLGIRNIEKALGSKEKVPSPSEMKNIVIARKSIHLALAKGKGEAIQLGDLEMLRPGDGISPMKIREILGKTINKELPGGHKLSIDDFNK